MQQQAAIPTDRKGALSRGLGWLCLPLVLLTLAIGAEARKSDTTGAEPQDLVSALLAAQASTPVEAPEEPDHDVIRVAASQSAFDDAESALSSGVRAPALKAIPAFIARAPPVFSC